MATATTEYSNVELVAAPVRVAIYCRISKDDLKQEKGVQRQLEDTRALCAQRGWKVVDEYTDNDLSASSGVNRPGYQQLLRDAEARRFERIVCYATSRLMRNRSERAQAIGLFGRLHISISTCKGPDMDLSTASGRMMGDMLGVFDTLEVEVMSERIQRALQQRAEEGHSHGRVAYGWRRIRDFETSGRIVGSHDEEEPNQASVVREIVERLLAGVTLRELTRNLNDRGVPAPLGKGWNATSVRQVALRPANIALRVHKGELYPASWPAIVDRGWHDRVVALLTAPGRQTKRPGKRRHLLTFGVGACGVCGGPLAAYEERYASGTRHWAYRCNVRGCVSRDLAKVDAFAEQAILELLSGEGARGLFDVNGDAAEAARGRADAIRARLNLVADQFALNVIDGQQLARITATLRPELDAAEADVRRNVAPALPTEVTELAGSRAAETWAMLPVTAKRTVLHLLHLQVLIMPRKKGSGGKGDDELEFRRVAYEGNNGDEVL